MMPPTGPKTAYAAINVRVYAVTVEGMSAIKRIPCSSNSLHRYPTITGSKMSIVADMIVIGSMMSLLGLSYQGEKISTWTSILQCFRKVSTLIRKNMKHCKGAQAIV